MVDIQFSDIEPFEEEPVVQEVMPGRGVATQPGEDVAQINYSDIVFDQPVPGTGDLAEPEERSWLMQQYADYFEKSSVFGPGPAPGVNLIGKILFGVRPEAKEGIEAEAALLEGTRGVIRAPLEFGQSLTDVFYSLVDEEKKAPEVFREIAESDILKSDIAFQRRAQNKDAIDRYVQDVIGMVPQVASQVGAYVIGGKPLSMIWMGVQIAGPKYEQLRAEGVSPKRAFTAAIANASLQAPLEALSVGFMFKKFGGTLAKRLAKGMLTGGLSEFFTEWAQKYPELATDLWAKRDDLTLEKFIDATKEGVYEGLVALPLGMVGGAGEKDAKRKRPGGVIDGKADAAAIVDEAFARRQDAEEIIGRGEELDRSIESAVKEKQEGVIVRRAVETLERAPELEIMMEGEVVEEIPASEIITPEGRPAAFFSEGEGFAIIPFPEKEIPGVIPTKKAKEPAPEEAKIREDVIVGIPKLKTTKEAIAFGKIATPEQVSELRKLREESLEKNKQLMAQDKFEEAMAEATRGQYFREAVEAYEGKLKFRKEEEAVKGIPKFKTSQQAIKFGEDATPEQVEQLRTLRKEATDRSKRLLAEDKMQEYMNTATEIQFYKEALQAGEGRLTVRGPGVPTVKPKKKVPVKVFKEDTDIPLYESIKKKPEYHAREKGLVASTEYLTPGQYLVRGAKALGVTVKEFRAAAFDKTVDKYAKAMAKGDVFPALSIEAAKGYQEGRHRAMAAEKIGVKKIPVTIVKKIPTLRQWREQRHMVKGKLVDYKYDATGKTARQINRAIDALYYAKYKIKPEKLEKVIPKLKVKEAPPGVIAKKIEKEKIEKAKKKAKVLELDILTRLAKSLNKEYGYGKEVVSMKDFEAVQTPRTKALKEIAEYIGLPGLEFYTSKNPFLNRTHGFAMDYKGKSTGMAINANKPEHLLYIFGHESWHQVQIAMPLISKKIEKYVMENRDELGYWTYHDARQKTARIVLERAGAENIPENPMSKEQIDREFMATFIGTRWSSKEFLDKLATDLFKDQPGIMERILSFFDALIRQIKSILPQADRNFFVGEIAKLDKLVIHAYKTMGMSVAAQKVKDNIFDPEVVWKEGTDAVQFQEDIIQEPKIKTLVENRTNVARLIKKYDGVDGLQAKLVADGVEKKNAARIGALARNMEQWPFPTPAKTATQLIKHDKKDPEARKWYEKTKWLERVFENEEELDLFKGLALLTHTSRNKGTLGNMVEFIKFRTQTKAGQKILAPGLVGEKTIDRVLNADTLSDMFKIGSTKLGFESGEVKVKAFAEIFAATMRKNDELRKSLKAVVDVWVNRYYFPSRLDPSGKKEMALTPIMHHRIQEHIKEVQREIQKRTGEFWYVDEIQATIWFHTRDLWEKEGVKEKQQVGYTFDETLVVMAQRWAGMTEVDDELVQAYIDQKLRDPDRRHVLDHYTKPENDFTVAFPDYQGTGIITGREWTQQDPNNPRPRRIHFYEAGRMPEPGLQAAQRMRAVIDSSRIYDLGKDEHGYRERFGTLMEKPDPGRLADMENQLIDDGWIGFNVGSVTVVFEPTRVYGMKRFVLGLSPMVEKKVLQIVKDVYPEQAARLELYRKLEANGEFEKLMQYMKDDMNLALSHPLFDIKTMTGADGRWQGGNEFAIFVELEAGNFDILRGRVAEFLLNNAQMEGLVSEVRSDVGDYARPANIPKSQGPSVILKFNKPFSQADLEKISKLMSKTGIFGSTYVESENALMVHHLLYRDPSGKLYQSEDQFLSSVRQLASYIEKEFSKLYEGYGHVWFKHNILKNNWTDRSIKTGKNKYSPKGEAYEKIIKTGKVTGRNLGFVAWPPDVQGVYGEDVPALDRYPSLLTGPTRLRKQKPIAKKRINDFVEKKKKNLQDFELDRIKQWIKTGMADSVSYQDRQLIVDMKAAGDSRVQDIEFPPLQETLPFDSIQEDVEFPYQNTVEPSIPGEKKPTLFHGSFAKIDRLLPREEISEEFLDPAMSSLGFYTTDSYSQALTFGNNIIELEPPKKIKDLTDSITFDDFVNALPIDRGKHAHELKRMQDSSHWYGDIQMQYKLLEEFNDRFNIVDALKKQGYDSLKYKEEHFGKSGNTTVFFDIDQVKIKKREALNYSWETYRAAEHEAGKDKNILVKSGKSKYALIQISSNMAREEATQDGDEYFDKLYAQRTGYDRPSDFWEIPEWIGQAAKTFKDADLYVVRNTEEAVHYLNQAGYDAVMFSVMDANKDIIRSIAERFDGTTIVGGYADPKYFRKTSGVKFVGSIEEAAGELGVKYTSGIDYRHFEGTKTVPRLECSGGCLHKCAFCTVPKKIVEKTEAEIDAQVDQYKDLDYQLVYLNDKTFGQAKNYKYLVEVNKRIREKNPNFKGFVIQTTAPAFLKLEDDFLKESGIKYVELGVETFNDNILSRINKPHRTKQIRAAVDKIRRHDMVFIPNVMVGLAGVKGGKLWTETEETYQNTLDFLKEQADIISHVNAYVLAVYEGTALNEQIGTGKEIDGDENVVEKSWLKNKDLHQGFYRDLLDFAQERLDHGDIKKVQKKSAESMRVMFDVEMPGARDTINQKIGHTEKTFGQRVADGVGAATKSWRYKYLDRVDPIRQRLGGEYGAAYMHARGVPGVRSSMVAFMEHGKLKFDDSMTLTTDTRKQGFITWLNSLGRDAEKFFYWLVAKRAEALEAEGREKWLLQPDRERIWAWTGHETVDGRSFEDINKEFQSWNDSVLDLAIESGLLTQQQVDDFRQEFYVPFYRIMEDQVQRAEFLKGPSKGKGLNLSAQIRRLKGAEARIGDPVENIMRNWTHLIGESIANVARREAAEYALDNSLVNEAGEALVEEVPWTETVIFRPGKKDRDKQVIFIHQKTGEQILSYRVDGKAKFIRVNDPELFGAMSNMNKPFFNYGIMKWMSGSKRVLTYGATFGPAFKVRNMIRDTLHTFLISKNFKPFIDTARGMVKAWRQDDEMVKLIASGHAFGGSYVKAEDPAALSKYVDRLVKKEGEDFWKTLLNTPAKMLHFWERLGDASENAARVALYSNLRAKGKTHLEAAFRARDLMDFQMSGAAPSVQFLTQTIPFLNARLQGLYRMGRGFAEDPKVFLAKGAAIAVASIALWAAFKDDDRYKELEDWEKWAYYHFWIGDKHFRIPKPFETGVIFSSMFESAGNVLAGDEEFEHFVSFLKHAFVETLAFNPLLGIQLIKPLAEQWANKVSFTGRPIEGMSLQGLRWGDRYDPWTSETMRLAGKLGIPPKRAEAFIRGYFATFGMFLLGISDILVRNIPFFDFPERPAKRLDDYPLIGAFIRETPTRHVKTMTAFYDTFRELEEVARTVNFYKRSGMMEEAKRLQKDEEALLRMRKRYLRVKRELSAINREIRRTWLDKNMSPEDKKKWIDSRLKRKNKLVTDIYNAHKEAK